MEAWQVCGKHFIDTKQLQHLDAETRHALGLRPLTPPSFVAALCALQDLHGAHARAAELLARGGGLLDALLAYFARHAHELGLEGLTNSGLRGYFARHAHELGLEGLGRERPQGAVVVLGHEAQAGREGREEREVLAAGGAVANILSLRCIPLLSVRAQHSTGLRGDARCKCAEARRGGGAVGLEGAGARRGRPSGCEGLGFGGEWEVVLGSVEEACGASLWRSVAAVARCSSVFPALTRLVVLHSRHPGL